MSLAFPALATGTPFPHFISGLGGSVFAVVLALVALALMFAGRRIIKGLAFLVVGLAVAAFGVATGGVLLGVIGAVIGGVAGFLVGGLIGLLLVDFGMGLALGYFAYLATRYLTHSLILAVVVGIVLFFVGVAISSKLLELVTAVGRRARPLRRPGLLRRGALRLGGGLNRPCRRGLLRAAEQAPKGRALAADVTPIARSSVKAEGVLVDGVEETAGTRSAQAAKAERPPGRRSPGTRSRTRSSLRRRSRSSSRPRPGRCRPRASNPGSSPRGC